MSAPTRTLEVPDQPVDPPSGSAPRRWPRWSVIAAVLAGVVLLVLGAITLFGAPWTDSGSGAPEVDEVEPPAPDPDTSDPADQQPDPSPADDANGPDAPPADDEDPAEAPVIRFGEEPPANWDVTGVAADDVLNVRSGPGVAYGVTATLPPNTFELESTGRIARVDGVLWREIKVPGGTAGWVNARYLTEYGPPAGLEDVGVGLPTGAQLTAREVYTFAQRGDLDSLARLALDGDAPFTASFGDEVTTPAELVGLWERIGRDEVLEHLDALVRLPDWYETVGRLPDGQAASIHVTPRFMHEPTAANRSVLEQRLGATKVEAGIADGQWLGWRLGITADGDWMFFVSGD
jgi:hypothetical protein